MFRCTCAKIKQPGNSGSDCIKNSKPARPVRRMVQLPGELTGWTGRGERSLCILPAQSRVWARLKARSQGRGRAGVSSFYCLLSLHIKRFSLLADPAPVQPCHARLGELCQCRHPHWKPLRYHNLMEQATGRWEKQVLLSPKFITFQKLCNLLWYTDQVWIVLQNTAYLRLIQPAS